MYYVLMYICMYVYMCVCMCIYVCRKSPKNIRVMVGFPAHDGVGGGGENSSGVGGHRQRPVAPRFSTQGSRDMVDCSIARAFKVSTGA